MKIPFIKMQGLGNDFIVIDDMDSSPDSSAVPLIDAQWVRRVCDRRFGIGADQVLWMVRPKGNANADARMEIRNSDGSTAEMCGNGIRAIALFMAKKKPKHPPQYLIETLAGVKAVEVIGEHARVDMGVPILGAGFSQQGETLQAGSRSYTFFEVNMGNPHAVIFDDYLTQVDLEGWGPAIENHPRFPNKTNVEWVSVHNRSEIEVKVWERGAGVTLACGTGACASAVAALALKKVTATVQVRLPGGNLWIDWKGPGHSVIMEGPAAEVFRGEI